MGQRNAESSDPDRAGKSGSAAEVGMQLPKRAFPKYKKKKISKLILKTGKKERNKEGRRPPQFPLFPRLLRLPAGITRLRRTAGLAGMLRCPRGWAAATPIPRGALGEVLFALGIFIYIFII